MRASVLAQQYADEIERAIRLAKMTPWDKWPRKQGHESDHEFGCPEDRTEVSVNSEGGRGVAIDWFWLPEVGP